MTTIQSKHTIDFGKLNKRNQHSTELGYVQSIYKNFDIREELSKKCVLNFNVLEIIGLSSCLIKVMEEDTYPRVNVLYLDSTSFPTLVAYTPAHATNVIEDETETGPELASFSNLLSMLLPNCNLRASRNFRVLLYFTKYPNRISESEVRMLFAIDIHFEELD